MKNKRWFLPILLLLAMLIAACGAAAEPTDTPPLATAGTTQGGDDGDEEGGDDSGAQATQAPLPTTADEPTEEAEPTAEPTEAASDDGGDDSGDDGGDDNGDDGAAGDMVTIEEAEDIQSYRFRAQITAEGEAFSGDDDMAMFADGITIEGAFVKDPAASDVSMEIPGLGEVGFREVDGQAYSNFGGTWVESSPDEALDVDDFTPVGDDEILNDLDRLEEVGTEEVNGRETTHYRGDKEVLQAMAEEGDESFDFGSADEAQLDLWLDQEYGFVVKMELTAEGAGLNEDEPDLEGRVEFIVEYFDFNEDIEIEAPEDVMDSGDTGDSGDDSGDDTGDDSSDASTLPELLGFDLELPEGAEADVSFGTATITLQMPMDEAAAYLTEQFEGAGYTLDETLSTPEDGFLWFDNGETQWYITLTETDGVTEAFIL